MINNFPSIGEYNISIQKNGGSIFSALKRIKFIPSTSHPIKIYLYGGGAFAAVFKGNLGNENFAIRCFLSAEKEHVKRYHEICKYLDNINSNWQTKCEYYDNEIKINNSLFPVIKMEWVDGLLINAFVTNNLSSNDVLSRLQSKLISLSIDLEKNKIGHGDLQCGNIIITGDSSNFEIRLIDYDGMYVPNLINKKSLEKGRSEFQHPNRSDIDFNPEMDRFSIWVMIAALEALKYDKTLWREVMQGGFNTLDNFLFLIQDFQNPSHSPLFKRLYDLNKSSMNFYLDKLKLFCYHELSEITRPEIFNENNKNKVKHAEPIKKVEMDGKFIISTNVATANILTSNFQKLGSTPIVLSKKNYEGKTLLVSNGFETKRIIIKSNQENIEVNF